MAPYYVIPAAPSAPIFGYKRLHETSIELDKIIEARHQYRPGQQATLEAHQILRAITVLR
jgi:hypothetical protein